MVAIKIHIYLFQSNCKPAKKAKKNINGRQRGKNIGFVASSVAEMGYQKGSANFER